MAAAIWGPNEWGSECVGALRQLCSGTNNQRKVGKKLLHCLLIFSVHFKSTLSSTHVQGAKNSTADATSCTQIVMVAKTLSIDLSRAISPHPSGSLC